MDFGSRCSGRNPRAELVLGGEKGSIENRTLGHFVFQCYSFFPATSTSSHLRLGGHLQYVSNDPSCVQPAALPSPLCRDGGRAHTLRLCFAATLQTACKLRPRCPQAPMGMAGCIWKRSNHVASYKLCINPCEVPGPVWHPPAALGHASMATVWMKENRLVRRDWQDHRNRSMDTDTVALKGLHSGFPWIARPLQTHTFIQRLRSSYLGRGSAESLFLPDLQQTRYEQHRVTRMLFSFFACIKQIYR